MSDASGFTSDDEEQITEATYGVRVVEPWMPLKFSFDSANAFFLFDCPSQKLADNFDAFLSKSDFLTEAFEGDDDRAVAILTGYLHPLTVWLALRGFSHGRLDVDALDNNIHDLSPTLALGSQHQALFVKGLYGIRVTDELPGVYVQIGEPMLWLQSSLLMSAFDWSADGEPLQLIRDYLYPLTYFFFIEQT